MKSTSTNEAPPKVETVGVGCDAWLAKIARLLTDAQNASVACGEWRQGDEVPYLEVLDKSLAARKALMEEIGRVRELRSAIEQLPDLTLDDVPRGSIPTHELIRRIRACRALLG